MFLFATVTLIFLSTMIWGIYNNIMFMRKVRAKRNYKSATLNITEKVIPERRIEPSTWMVTFVLDIGQVLLGVSIIFHLFIRSKSDSLILHPQNSLTLFIFYLLCSGAVSASGYLFGSTIARAILSYFSEVRHMAFSEQGILYAGKIIAWDHFRGYAVSSERKYIYLLSNYYPTAIGFSFAPTSDENFSLTIGEIKKHLQNCDFAPYGQDAGIFMNIYFQSAFLSIVLLLIGLTGLMMPIEIGIMLSSLLMFLHTTISLRIVNRIIPTDKFSIAEVE